MSALMLAAACTCGSGPYEGDYFDGDRPGPMDYKFVEGEKGDPKVVGCADGQREGFADIKKNPRVAGCIGNWKGSKSLRDKAGDAKAGDAKPTGKACGDDGAECTVPADVCAAGWHVCGGGGSNDDVSLHTSTKECDNAGPGRFNAALSHSPTDEVEPCPTIKAKQNLPCVQSGLGSEPVCCGNDCKSGKCKDGVWKGKTKISVGTSEGCGAVTADHNGGVMCCFDGEGNPADAKAEDPKAGDTQPAGDPKTGDAKAGDAKAGDAKAGDAKAGDAKAGDAKAGDAKAGDTKAGDTKAGDTKTDTKTGDAKTGDAKTGDTKTGDTKTDAKTDAKTGDAKKPAGTK